MHRIIFCRMQFMSAKSTPRFRRILLAFRERLKSSTCSSVIDDANTLMTKTGVAVTVIFVSSVGYNITHQCLGKIGAVAYVLNAPMQRVGMLLAAFNSVANPFVYVFLVPAFRDSLRKTFHLPSLRCHVFNKSVAIEGSRSVGTSSDTVKGGTDVATSDIDDRGRVAVSPNTIQLEPTSVTHIV